MTLKNLKTRDAEEEEEAEGSGQLCYENACWIWQLFACFP